MIEHLRNIDPFTFSVMLDNIDGDDSFFIANKQTSGPTNPGAPSRREQGLHLKLTTVQLDDDASFKPGWVGMEKENLVQHFIAFELWIERTTRVLSSMEIGTRTDMFTAFYGGALGQLTHASLRLLEKYSAGDVSTTTHAKLLEGLYPWVAELLEGDDFERQAAEAVAHYWAFRKEVTSQEKTLGINLMAIDEDEDLFGAAGQKCLQAAATALSPLATRRFRRPKG